MTNTNNPDPKHDATSETLAEAFHRLAALPSDFLAEREDAPPLERIDF